MFPYAARDLFGIEGFDIPWYGIWVAAGVIAALAVFGIYSAKAGTPRRDSEFFYFDSLLSIAAGFLSAGVFQGLFDYIADPSAGFSITGGITFLGGLAGGAACFLLVYILLRKKTGADIRNVLPTVPCAVALGHALGRIGCFFAGCCYGMPTDSPLGVRFPGMTEKVLPTQLFEAVFLFVLFAVLSVMLLRFRSKSTLQVYLISYGIFRFLIEFLRGDDRGSFIGPLSPSQTLSAVAIAAGSAMIIIPLLKKRRNGQ